MFRIEAKRVIYSKEEPCEMIIEYRKYYEKNTTNVFQ